MEQLTGSKLGKEYIKVRVHNVKCQAGWVTGWNQGCKGIINNLRCAGDTALMVENEEELKCLLMKVKEESEKADLKLNMRKINNLRYADDTSLNGRMWRGTKVPLDEGEREQWKSWLKIQHSNNEDQGIWSHHFMANKWGNNGNGDRFYFLGHQSHCRWWLQPWN